MLTPLDELIGQKIVEIRIEGDKDVLVFKCQFGRLFGFRAYGDCCSKSWFEHLNNVKECFGHTVTEIIERAMPESIYTNGEEIQFYGYSIKHHGFTLLDIEFRNSSNGYYGGDLTETEISDNEFSSMKIVTEDF